MMDCNDMIAFGDLDQVKQGEILVAYRNGDPLLQQLDFCTPEVWGDIKGIRKIYNDIVYRIRAAPRECYVRFNKDDHSVETASYQFNGSVLMREVMED
jgi:hypothetical protein